MIMKGNVALFILKWQQLYQITKRIKPSKKGLFNFQSINDNECFIWHLVKYLHPAYYNVARIRKSEKDFARKLDFKDKTSCSNQRYLQGRKKELYQNQCFPL